MRYRHVLGIASLSALVIATGCGESAELSSQTPSPSSPSGSPMASPEAEPTDTPPIAPIAPYDPAGPVDPITSEMFGGLTAADLESAIDAAIAECMATIGFEYTARTFGPAEPLTRQAAYEYRRQYAFGIHRPPPTAVDSSNDPNLKRLQAMTSDELDRYLDALEGPERGDEATARSGGCRQAAEDQLASQHPVLAANSADRLAAVRAQLGADGPAHSAAMTAYAACMKSNDYAIDSPAAARSAGADAASFDEELRLAIADLDCQATTLWPYWDQLLAN